MPARPPGSMSGHPLGSGNSCSSVNTGLNKSPIVPTRYNTSEASKRSSRSPDPQSFTSSRVTGVETVGASPARSEYGRSSSCGVSFDTSRRRSCRAVRPWPSPRAALALRSSGAPSPVRRPGQNSQCAGMWPRERGAARTSATPSFPMSCTNPQPDSTSEQEQEQEQEQETVHPGL
jgi:hypothetical protein